jgi:hypothetical protein
MNRMSRADQLKSAGKMGWDNQTNFSRIRRINRKRERQAAKAALRDVV